MIRTEDLIVPSKLALLGIFIGAVSGLAIAQMNPGPTLAAVVANPPFNIGKPLDTDLLKLNGDYYAVGHAPEVSMEPKTHAIVRKIGYGETRFVTIDTTASGTYSSDGLASPYVSYPGIYKERVRVLLSPFWGDVLGWSKLGGWVKIPLVNAQSIAYLDDDRVPRSSHDVCVADNHMGGCR